MRRGKKTKFSFAKPSRSLRKGEAHQRLLCGTFYLSFVEVNYATPSIILDGDGAALMRVEAMISIGHYHPSNLLHVILDNESHESTGGQATLSPTAQFTEIAAACGYQSSVKVFSAEKLADTIRRSLVEKGPHLIHVKVKCGSEPSLGRSTVTPVQVKKRFMKLIGSFRPSELW